tara:strand:+ start:16319 stop:16513 length:195 start_codon:yes stop_codon:yes gene_type:complete
MPQPDQDLQDLERALGRHGIVFPEPQVPGVLAEFRDIRLKMATVSAAVKAARDAETTGAGAADE